MLTPPTRLPLAVLPTPLVHAPRLSAALDREVWIKRDDMTGFALGGNKVRVLEVLLAEAIDQRCDHVVGCGGPASNLCSALAAAAAVAGLRCTLVLHGSEPAAPHPNLALMRMFGAQVRFTGDPGRASTPEHAAAAADRLRRRGHHPYIVPRGAASGVGATAYALAAEELAAQLTFRPAHVVVAVGSGGTVAGLLAGWAGSGVPGTLVGVAVSRPLAETRREVIRLACEAATALGAGGPDIGRLRLLDGLGAGFGRADRTTCDAARLALRTEGIMADTTYVARAVAVLGSLDGPLVLWHTGGWLGCVGEAMGIGHG
ncbi:MAG TPA: pyridoxal-phosphate dependent enzyme [Acidimicrobiales bacterium]|nr:pyridoxal-phosphate dependent enzyme [Acidimicrobiales bacterium]